MADDVYMPPKPFNPYADGTCGPNRQPHGEHHECGCAPVPPHPAPPGFCWDPGPGLKQIPPIPKVCEGESLYQAMNAQITRTNACIEQWNMISRNCFAAMHACVEAARANDVYYDDCEVHYQTGYDENEGCAYALVEKKSVDRNGQPIFVKLVPAFNNSTNSGITQDIFDVSFIESANLIVTAVPTGQANWYGPAMWQGAPIPGIDQNIMHPIEGQDPMPALSNPGWVYGFNRQGWLRFFNAKDVDHTILCQNAMVDVMGSCWPILSDNELTETANELTNKASITAIGFNKGTGSVFFFSCSAQDQPGMSGVAVAKLLQGYGCTTAVITSMIMADDKTESAGMLYMAQMTTVPQAGRSPSNLAYWVISKRPNFKNRFQKEIADLVQTTGQNSWKNYLLGAQIQDFDDRIIATEKAIKDEVERATQAEKELQDNINAETNRAMEAEKLLQDNINAEVDRATAAEKALDYKIDAETQRAMAAEKAETDRATAAEAELNQKIIDETNRATTAENSLAADIAAEKLRAQTRENEIQAALDKEIRERVSADNDIINALEQEVLARRAADTALQNNIDAVKNELKIDINNINNIVNGITGGQTELPYLKLTGGTLTGPLTISGENTVTLGRGPTEDMEAATKKYVDDAIAAGGGGGGGGGDVTKAYVDQQVSTLQTQITNKVSKSGDTMTGALDMNGQKLENAVLSSNTGTAVDNGAGGPGTITNLADPVNPTDAVNLQTLEKQIEDTKESLGTDFLPTAGGNMTGDINMTDTSVINFYDPDTVNALMDKNIVTASSTMAAIRPSATAKRLGITAELIADAAQRGLDVNSTTTVADYASAMDLSPQAVIGQALKGSVYNDDSTMCISSEADIGLKPKNGTVMLSNQSGNECNLRGVRSIGIKNMGLIFMDTEKTSILGPLNVSSQIGDANGTLNAGVATIGGVTLEPHAGTDGDTHLDIDVPTSKGAVYINRSENGNSVSGGTGELHVTEIHAPNELVLRPGTSVNVNGARVKNVGNATEVGDALSTNGLSHSEYIDSTNFLYPEFVTRLNVFITNSMTSAERFITVPNTAKYRAFMIKGSINFAPVNTGVYEPSLNITLVIDKERNVTTTELKSVYSTTYAGTGTIQWQTKNQTFEIKAPDYETDLSIIVAATIYKAVLDVEIFGYGPKETSVTPP